MVSFDYAFHHIERVWQLALGDEDALSDMDITAEGFWRSFHAILFAFPAMFFSWVMEARDLLSFGSTHSMGYLVIVTAFMELVMWILPIVILAFALKPLGHSNRYSHLIIARNWFSVIVAYFYTLLALPSLVFPGFSVPLVIVLGALFLFLVLLIRITRLCLQAENSIALGLVLGEFFLLIGFAAMFYAVTGFYSGTGSS